MNRILTSLFAFCGFITLNGQIDDGCKKTRIRKCVANALGIKVPSCRKANILYS